MMNDCKIKGIINSSAFLVRIIRNVEHKVKRNLTDKEETEVIQYIKNVSHTYFKDIPLEKIMQIISNSVIEEFNLNHYEEKIIDVHELLKENLGNTIGQETVDQHKVKKECDDMVEVNIESIFGLHDMATVIKKINEPISSVNNAYFLLDSRYRILDNDGTTCFKWGHINSIVLAQGTYNSVGNIRDIISIKLMPYRIPAVSSAITPYGRISTFIQELCPQSFIAHEERRFHFLGDVETKGNWLSVDSGDFSDGEFKFNKPITHLDTITISFGSPLEPITFDKDRLIGSITYTNPMTILFPEIHNVTTGETVYITNFTTLNPCGDSHLISSVNSITGNIATETTTSEITIPIDVSSLLFTATGALNTPSVTLLGQVTPSESSNIIIGTGTSFNTDFIVGDYIEIQNGESNPIYKIINIINNKKLKINGTYTEIAGSFQYRKTGVNITGIGTLFLTELQVGDNIIINDGVGSPAFIIKSIQNNTNLTLGNPYNGADGVGFAFDKNNIDQQNISVFFGSKRVFIPLEITYLSS